MIAAGDPNDEEHQILFLVSAACGWEEPLKFLLKRGCLPKVELSAPILESVKHKDPEQYPFSERPTALALAAQGGHLPVVDLLLQKGTWV
jgi:hypothetical protein